MIETAGPDRRLRRSARFSVLSSLSDCRSRWYRRPRGDPNDACGNDVGAGAGQDRQRIAMAEVEREARGARTDQGAERNAGVENADEPPTLRPPK